jgi:hypothetical protein
MSSEQLQIAISVPTAVSMAVVGSRSAVHSVPSGGATERRPRRIAAWLVSAMLAAAPVEAFAAQRGSQPSRPQSAPSRPQSAPSRPQSAPSRPQSAPSRPQSAPSRPQSAPSRPQSAPSRPQSAPSRPQSAPSRAQAQPSRPQPQAQPTRPQPQAQPTRPHQQAPATRPGSVEPSGAGTNPAAGRGWTPAAPSPSAGGSEPSAGNVIDFGSGESRPPRRTTPLLQTRNSARPGTTSADRTVPGEGPSSAVRARTGAGGTNTSEAGIESARRAAAARSTSIVRERTANRADILQRYRGATASAGPEAPTRSAAGDTNAARIAEARRSAAALTDAASDAPQRTAAGSDAPRARSATPPTNPDAVAARVAQGRKDYVASIAARTAAARGGAAATGGAGGVGNAGAVPAVTTAPYGGGHYSSGTPYNGYCHNGWGYDYGHCYWNYWGGYCGHPFSWWLFAPFYGCGYWWSSYWYCGGYWNPWYYPSYYWYGPVLPYSTAVIVQSEPEVVYVESEPEVGYVDEPAGEAVVPLAPAQPSANGELNRAADYYLSLGDRAFREARYGDAVHYYAKAIEFSPEDGILHLVLADALFATGDYRYAAYALRTAFEKDPALAANVVDKRSFYANPADFDAQLALLERYLEDHFLDDDARLVLAANYLFGGRPIDTVKLLESPFSESLRATPPGKLMLDVARELKDRPAVK